MSKENNAVDTNAVLTLIERTVTDPNVDVLKIEKLIEMSERIAVRNAETAFYSAMATMQSELPVIVEDAKTYNKTQYASFEHINEIVKPILFNNGFAISFRTGRDNENITITGVLTHKQGHREETTITLPSDISGNKNAVQAIGSSTSYGKRYVLCALLNIATKGEDDDGDKAIKKGLTQSQIDLINNKLAKLPKDRQEGFINVYGKPSDMARNTFNQAVSMLDKAINANNNV